ncbi:Pkinase-domain-containing protein [Dendrothele bispora CBS 962.96]|uniref:Pkinase-domain-containing protein n=1 Tax=Dendrothele bispora (strain CBS 962.96) TaxID=1314807 RepID=A0A4V6T4Y6_DENBC|nr:Pkinase-domain-containing protein [Dendrothele bispora CBS 962.96]
MSEAAQASKAQKVAKPQDLHSSDFTFCEVDDGKLLLLEELGSGPQCLRKFEKNSRNEMFQMREFVLHKKVSSHPNVVNFYDAFYEHDHVFVVLELCEGGDLFTAIVNHGLFEGNDKLIKSCFTQILDGLYHCHRKLVFHRDLKPENILCSRDGTHFRLADFGLATDQQESQSYGCGSAEYMSPECIGKGYRFGKKPYSTAQNDIWALGIILINLITARSPWKHAGTEDHCFSNFLENPTWLLDSLPISSDFFRGSIFGRVWANFCEWVHRERIT